MKTAYIICPVRLADDETRKKLEDYAIQLETQGYTVHLPHRDTDQSQSDLDICIENSHAISRADEIHIFYNPRSSGIHFDMGVAFVMDIICGNHKKIVIAENDTYEGGRSLARFMVDWSEFRNTDFDAEV